MVRLRAFVALASVLAAGALLVACGGQQVQLVSADHFDALLKGSPPALQQLHELGGTVRQSSKEAFARTLRSLRGYPVVINVWAEWCPPCRGEFPIFQRSALRFGRRVAFVGLDEDDSTSKATSFLRSYPVPYPSFSDPSGTILHGIGRIIGLPATIFLDSNHKVTGPLEGAYRSDAQLDAAITRYALD
jgi:cytochrome c biogenesis protein CcmG/thiol:disulfide interchange protein DsbE